MSLPTLYLPHGGGPCFFMDWPFGPPDTWEPLAAWLRGLPDTLPQPEALLVVSAHWEAPEVRILAAPNPTLLYDYSGFPPHTYELTWPAPGHPALATKIQSLLEAASIPCRLERDRGFDHGVFVPLKLVWPEADVPTVQVSLRAGLDPATHLAVGRALAPLRNQGILILGSGSSYHNMRNFMRPEAATDSERFDAWLVEACTGDPAKRADRLVGWETAPAARESHPREEHLLPLMVAAGAAEGEPGEQVFHGQAMGATLSAFQFGSPAPRDTGPR
jgi:aromatic ring-opening dioxygenase catalytic subunit (LigB family)